MKDKCVWIKEMTIDDETFCNIPHTAPEFVIDDHNGALSEWLNNTSLKYYIACPYCGKPIEFKEDEK